MKCLSDHIFVKHVAKKSDFLKYRTKSLWKLVSSVLKGNRLNYVLGLHGIGKTSLVKTASRFLMERKYFTGGLLYFPIKSHVHCRSLLQDIQLHIQEDYGLDKVVFNQDLDTYETELENWIIAFFNQSSLNSKLRISEKKHYS